MTASPFFRHLSTGGKSPPVTYRDGKGEQRPMYELTERQALKALPFIAGRAAYEVQDKLVDGFMDARRFIEGIADGVDMGDPLALMNLANSILAEREQKKTKEQLTVTQLAALATEHVGRLVKPQEMSHVLCVQGFQKRERKAYLSDYLHERNIVSMQTTTFCIGVKSPSCTPLSRPVMVTVSPFIQTSSLNTILC